MSTASSLPWDGLLVLDKPEGPTSHDVVARVRRHTGVRRVGHSGTLDPPASGLLLVAIGRATRLIRFLPQQPKQYAGTLRLGFTTSTDDAEGEIVDRYDGALPSAADVTAAATTLEGAQMQVPPAVSARKIEGERMYRIARRGESVAAPAKAATVHRFSLEPAGNGEYAYCASVSSGTYIRSLARDLGEKLGCGAHIRTLRRTAIGPIGLAGAADPMPREDIREVLRAAWTPLDRIQLALATRSVIGATEERLFRSGVVLDMDRFGAESAGDAIAEAADLGDGKSTFLRIVSPAGALLGVAEESSGRLRPVVVIPV